MNNDNVLMVAVAVVALVGILTLGSCAYQLEVTLPQKMAEKGYCWYPQSYGGPAYRPCGEKR
jgi:hypothetical protein